MADLDLTPEVGCVAEPMLAHPCRFGGHRRGATCDCLICGWHVWDDKDSRDADGRVVIDGSICSAGLPRADRAAR